MLARTPNIANPLSKSPARAHADLCVAMLKEGRGASFVVSPPSGVLTPFAEHDIEITAFSDMWGLYSDVLICKVDGLEEVRIPITMNVIGCPLQFQMTATVANQQAVLRFGTHVSGVAPVTRQARILNSSPFDVRADWQLFNTIPGDQGLIDFVVSIGDAFPPHTLKRYPTEYIPNSRDSTSLGDDTSAPGITIADLIKRRQPFAKVTMRLHEGMPSNNPYEIIPSQMVIPAKKHSLVSVQFTPHSSQQVTKGQDCIGFGLGYLSLDGQMAQLEGKVSRLQGYDVPPVKLNMTAHVKPALLTMECTDDEGMQYRVAASDLMKNGQLVEESFKVNSVMMINGTGTALVYTLTTDGPFAVVSIDPESNHITRRTQKTKELTLLPGHNMLVKVAFSLTLDLLSNLEILEPGFVSEDSVALDIVGNERRLQINTDLKAEFNNGTSQVVLLSATVTVPSLILSKSSLDFGTCLVGQQRELQIELGNKTGSVSYWSCSQETSSQTCLVDTFEVKPASGTLDAYITHVSRSSVTISIFFTAKDSEDYSAVFLFKGLLGEETMRLEVKGQGSHDEKHEAVLNV